MKYAINIHHEHGNEKFGESLSAISEKTLSIIEAQSGSLSIALVDDSEIQDLNLRYRGIDGPTDVLAFRECEVDLESGIFYFGDVIISIQMARRQAKSAGHPLETELALLAVHGILHLVGYDHLKDEDAAVMESMQADILQNLASMSR